MRDSPSRLQVLRKAVFMGLPVATAVPPLAVGED